MSKSRKIIILVLAVGIVSLILLYLVGFFKPEGAGISIITTPAASVFIDGEQVGRTPYDTILPPGETVIRLIPDSFETPLIPFEKKLTLVSGVETVINRDFAESDEVTSGEILSFEKTAEGDTNIVVLSEPDSAQVKIDGSIVGFAPRKISDVIEGEHVVSVSAPGYTERTITVNAIKGFSLTAIVSLSKSAEVVVEEVTETPSDEQTSETSVKYVEILSTPTNFLRVRSEASTLSDEVGRVSPGEKYEYIETDEDEKWIKLVYEEGKEGWVSAEYTKVLEETSAVNVDN